MQFSLGLQQEEFSTKIVTINIPDQYLDCIETLVNLGYFPSRSEAVREALKHFLSSEADLNRDMQPAQFRALKEEQLKALSAESRIAL